MRNIIFVVLFILTPALGLAEQPEPYCFVTADGHESPTLHIHPGDDLVIHLKNTLAPGAVLTMANMRKCPCRLRRPLAERQR
jgi:hypothetical protein